MKPLIGVSPDTDSGSRLRTRTPTEKVVYLWDRYLAALLDHGSLPVVLPVTEDKSAVRAMVERLDGVLLAGGNFDVPAEFFGQEPRPWLGRLKPERSRFERLLLLQAARRQKPVLGICGGMQLINVAFGGTLYQDIGQERPGSRQHEQKSRADKTAHWVALQPGTRLERIVRGQNRRNAFRVAVNSTHHQAVRQVAPGFAVNAMSSDGIVEGIEREGEGFVVGVQWHPELLYGRLQAHARILRAFVRAASASCNLTQPNAQTG